MTVIFTAKNAARFLAGGLVLSPYPSTARADDNSDGFMEIRNLPVVATLSSDKTTKTICSIDGKLAARETNETLTEEGAPPGFDIA
jgi:hypothetical protein